MRVFANRFLLAAGLSLLVAAPVAAKPTAETFNTSHGVAAELYNPCATDEYLAFAGYIELETVRRPTSSGGLALRATLSPMAGTWHWYGWNTTDPDFDPTLPRLGDPDHVYAIAGSTRARGTIDQLPGAVLLPGEFAVAGTGSSDGVVVRYTVEYMYDVDAMISAEVIDLTIRCTDGTLWPVVFAYFP